MGLLLCDASGKHGDLILIDNSCEKCPNVRFCTKMLLYRRKMRVVDQFEQ